VAFTGKLASMKRADAFALVRKRGGTPRQGVTKETKVLIVGELGWPLFEDGRPSNALSQAKSYSVPIASERRFLEWIGKRPPNDDARTYSAEQLASLSKLPVGIIEQLAVFGLIEGKDGLYGFRDLAAARQIAALLASGITLSVITRSLHDIRKWMPDARLSNLRLFPESSDRVLIEQLKGRTDKTGQFVMPMTLAAEDDADALFAQAQAAEDQGDAEAAEQLYRRVMRIDPADAAAPFNLANILRAQARAVEAEALYREATKIDPSFAAAWYNLADILEEKGRIEEAVAHLEQAVKAEPTYADAIFNLALSLQRLERLTEAASWWKRYLALDKESPWAAHARRALKYCEIAGAL
jgi:tetratricopeptide (TPR) repeat protein